MKFTAVIPARFQSTRLEGKVLLDLAGKPILQHVFEAAKSASKVDRVIIATDDKRIASVASSFGAECFMSTTEHNNGSSRCFEAFLNMASNSDVLLNLQGDEPFLQPEAINMLAEVFEKANSPDIATLVRPAQTLDEIEHSSFVKAIRSESGRIHWFSRLPIPFLRDVSKDLWIQKATHLIHLGLYGFRSDVIPKIQKLNSSFYEDLEKLEQLRWLECGYQIHAAIVRDKSFGIDTPEDLERARKIVNQ